MMRSELRCELRKALVVALLAAAALAVSPTAGAAVAPPSPTVICANCDPSGTGWTGCTQTTASESGGIPWLAHYRHYLVVSYCKSAGTITSLDIAAHGCDFDGAAACSAGSSWVTSGGVGWGFASATGHAVYIGALAGVPFAGTSVVNVSIPVG
jgi:hypothetical protein